MFRIAALAVPEARWDEVVAAVRRHVDPDRLSVAVAGQLVATDPAER